MNTREGQKQKTGKRKKMTVDSTMESFLRELPKCEHHVHLEGTLEPELLFKLASRNNVKLPKGYPKTVEELSYRYEHFKDLQDFLDLYYVGMSVLQKEQDFEDLAWEYLNRAHSEGLEHVECFFDPQGHTERGIGMDVVIHGFRNALTRAEKELGISTKLIMCLLKHLPVANSLQTMKDFKPYYQKGWIHGLGLDSTEIGNLPEKFTECYKYGRENYPEGSLYTSHAGEEGGPEYVEQALKYLKVSRIDHGIHSVEDPVIMKTLAERDVLLTVCPLSNKRLQVVDDVSEEPIRELLESGVPFSINSDDPAYFGGYILDNYLAVQNAFNLSVENWITIARNSVRCSVIDDSRKKDLYTMIDKCFHKYEALLD